MNDIMKILLIVAVVFGVWKYTGGDFSKLIPKDKKSTSSYEEDPASK